MIELQEYIALGYLGLFVGSFLAATILPFSSEALFTGMILGGVNPLNAIVIASLGNWLGGMTSFGLGYLGNWHWIETKLKVQKEKVESFKKWIDKYGFYSALLCWLPIVGDPLAIALGFFKVKTNLVALFMFTGKFIRYLLVYLLLSMI